MCTQGCSDVSTLVTDIPSMAETWCTEIYALLLAFNERVLQALLGANVPLGMCDSESHPPACTESQKIVPAHCGEQRHG